MKTFFISLLLCINFGMFAQQPLALLQESENNFVESQGESPKSMRVNPKGHWYLGAEAGFNEITTFYLGEPAQSFQAGILAEYYTGKSWSLYFRLKQFKTGLSFYEGGSGWSISSKGVFNGTVICLPINAKWEYRIFKNFRGYLKTGLAYNYETQSDYNFSSNLGGGGNYSRHFMSLTRGLGFSYFLNKKAAIYIDIESYVFGGQKVSFQTFLFPKNYYTENNHLNFGVKFNLAK